MKKRAVLLFLFSLFVFIAFGSNYAFAEEKDYYIRNLNIDVTVNEKKQCVVKERVDVHFNKKVEDFYKTINTEVSGENISVSKVNVAGAGFHVTNSSYDTSIVIEGGDTGFSGDKKFIIEYTIDYYKSKFDKDDVLNFDVLQDNYFCDIKNFSEKINMPSKLKAKNITLTSGRYSSDGENQLNVKTSINGNIIELTKNGVIEDGNTIKLNVVFEDGTFKGITDFKYNYVIKSKDVNIRITSQQEYNVTQKYCIDIIDESAEDNTVRLMSAGSSLDKISDFKCSNKDVKVDSFYDTAELPKKKGLVEFTVSYKQKPALDSDIRFNIYSGSKFINLDNMKFKISSAVPIKDYSINCDDEMKGKIDANKSLYDITILSTDNIDKNGLIDINVNVDKSKFTRPMKDSGLIKFLLAAVCFFLSLYVYKKYCIGEVSEIKKRFYAPEFMDSLKAGYLFNGEISRKNVASLIFYWCSHKHIRIKFFRLSDGDKFRVTKLSDLDDKHQKYEVDMFNKLFEDGGELVISKSNYSHILNKLYSGMKAGFLKELKEENMLYQKPAVLTYMINFCMYLSFVLLVYDRINESREPEIKFIIYSVIGALVLLLYSYFMKRCTIANKSGMNSKGAKVIVRMLCALPFFFVSCFMFIYKTTPFVITFMTILFLFVTICIKKYPYKGDAYYEEKSSYLAGLSSFLEENETAELDMLFRDDSEYFIKILPFAIALNKDINLINRVRKLVDKNFYEEKIYDYYILNCIFSNRNIIL